MGTKQSETKKQVDDGKAGLSRRNSIRMAGAGAVSLLKPKGLEHLFALSPGKTDNSATVPEPLLNVDVHPAIEEIALHRIAFGPASGDIDRLRQMGLQEYLHEQLHPVDSQDTDYNQRLAVATMKIQYPEGKDGKRTYPALNEDRPLSSLSLTAKELYSKLLDSPDPLAYQERERPLQEVKAAKILRATYSKWQLREVMTDFWHNHFSIDAGVDGYMVRVMFPVYDRDVIRKHSLGNFREFLEAVATSQPMLVYLNNNVSKASPANENYARELFELHTLGAEHYYNDLYQEWSKVPGATTGHPEGYIDQDVYEAARAFTGWTVADGQYDRGERLPKTGEFYYHDGWHDPYQKRVLAKDFDPYQPPMSDGRKVLDLVAFHPGTAHYICKKLCTRLVCPNPPESLVAKAKHTWMTYQKDELQIAKTISTIVLSEEFASTWGKALKMPFEAMIAFFRATESEVMPNDSVFGLLANMDEAQFAWPTPNGRPYDAQYWTGTSGILSRWNAMHQLAYNRSAAYHIPDTIKRPVGVSSFDEVCRFWEQKIFGRISNDRDHAVYVAHISQPFPKGIPELADKQYLARTQELIAMMAQSPEFHIR